MKKTFFLCGFIFVAVIAAFAKHTQGESYPKPFKKIRSLAWHFNLPVVKRIELPGNISLEYVEQGDLDGTPVIFLHGLTDSWHSYERVLPYLPKSVHAYAISLRGHGNSDRPWTGYEPADFAADVAAFMKKLRIKSAVIVGHSMGATVAKHFALDYPKRTKAVMLVGSVASFPNNPVINDFMKVVSGLTDPIDPAFAREFQLSTLAQDIPPAYLDTVVKESLKVPARVWKAALDGLVKDTKTFVDLNKPTLIIWGAKDNIASRADQDMLHTVIHNSKLVIYNEAGHGVHWEEPERFAKELYFFIQDIK